MKRPFLIFFLLALIARNSEAQTYSSPIHPGKGYDVKSYNATIWLNRQQDSISGWVEMNAIASGALTEILQHAKFILIDSVFVDAIRATTSVPDSTGAYEITGFPNTYQNGSAFAVKTYYHGKGMNEGGSYAWGGVQNMGNMMFSMGVGFNCPYVSCTRHWLPCYDEPDDKADSVTLRFFADTAGGIVVSNGLQTSYLAGTDGGKTNYFEWKISHPIATYLITFAFGKFEKVSIPNPLNIPFDVYAFAGDTAKVRLLMEKRVVPAVVYFDSLFGKYPFEKVGYVIAPIGSMEHQTMITLVNSVLDTNNTTAVHELSHQWWGDKTTCADFDNPWLNEGFAHFCESLFLERFSGEKKYWTQQHANIASALLASEDTIPLFAAPSHTKPRNNYPNVIYDKGASVLGMMRYSLGDSVFFDALRTYGNINAYSTATTADLESSIENSTKQDMRVFFNQWVYGKGHPALTTFWSKADTVVSIQFQQTQDSAKFGFFRQPIIIEARTFSGQAERHEVLLDSFRFTQTSFTGSFAPDTLIVDPDGAVIKKLNNPAKLGIEHHQPIAVSPDALEFFPNPSSEKKMRVVCPSPSAENISVSPLLEIFDSKGNRVSTINLDLAQTDPASGNAEYFFNIASLPSGTYFASMVLNDQITIKGKFVITK